MCTKPIQFENGVGACRNCDECLAARRSGWVARGMAELSQWKQTLSITLTYRDGEDGADFFAYYQVRDFIKRLNSAVRRIDKRHTVRFICAGEQGDRNGRCHWHIIVYSDVNLRTLGSVSVRGKTITDPTSMNSVGKRIRRLDWSLWPHGFVTFQEPSLAAMHYVLSYCLKDQFTIEKSDGSARIGKAENFATGLFRMSKRPAIGEGWLMQKLQDLDDKSAVLPHTNLSVPGLPQGNYWYPSGPMREKLLWTFRAINQRRIWSGLGECPQWPGLLEACKDNPSDLEILLGPQEQQSFEEVVRHKQIDAIHKSRDRLAAFRRQSVCLCQTCICEAENRERIAPGKWFYHQHITWWDYQPETGSTLDRFQIERRYGPENAYCEACGGSEKITGYPRCATVSGNAA